MKGKNNKGVIALLLIVIAILLVLVILLATGTINFNKKAVDNNNNTQTITDTKEDETKTWVDYLLSANIKSAEITRIRDKNAGDTEDFNKTLSLGTNDTKNILLELSKAKLEKIWTTGMGGPNVHDGLKIIYEKMEMNINLK